MSTTFHPPLLSTCQTCDMFPTNDRLVQVHVKSWRDTKGLTDKASYLVCEKCLVNHNVPVRRPSNGRWEIGLVQSYDPERDQHQIVFVDETKEWIRVSEDPYSDYVQQFVVEEERSQYRSMDCSALSFPSPYEPELEPPTKKKAPQSTVQRQKSQVTVVTSNRSSSTASPMKKKPPPVVYSPARLHTPLVSKKAAQIRGTVQIGTPNSQISALSGGTLSSTAGTSSATTTTSGSSKSKSSGTSAKKTLRLWTKAEDRALMQAVAANNYNLAWPKIAEAIPGRTGKQCRERYLNHLTPNVKLTGWSVAEDAMIFRLYSVEGSKWSRMIKFLPGRTDNAIKNRYHHLRRRFDRRMKSIGTSKAMADLMKKIQNSRLFHGAPVEPLLLKYLALKMLEAKRKQTSVMTTEYKFGPYYPVMKSTGCRRCGLMMPSRQTGRYICSSTGWCQTCCGFSPIVTGDALRIGHTIEIGHNP